MISLKYDSFIKEKNYIYLIFGLIPFAAIFSRLFLEFFLILLTGIFIFNTLKYKEFQILKDKKIYFFLVFYLFLIISYNLNEENYYNKIYFYIRFIFYYVSILYFLKKYNQLYSFFLKSILICFIVLSIDGLFQFYFGHNTFGYKILEDGRINSFFKDESILGGYIRTFLPFFFILFLITKKNIVIFLTLFLSIFIAFLSGERVNFFITINIIIISFCFFWKNGIYKKFIPIVALVLILITFFLSQNEKYYERYVERTVNELSKNYDVNKDIWSNSEFKLNFYIFSGYHTNLYKISYNAFLDKKIFGHGPRSFREFCSNENYAKSKLIFSCSTHPHNYLMQFLSELGLVGVFFLIFSYFYFLYKTVFYFFKKNQNNFEKIFFFSSMYLLFFLTPFVPSGNFFNNYLSCLFYIGLGFFSFFESKKKDFK